MILALLAFCSLVSFLLLLVCNSLQIDLKFSLFLLYLFYFRYYFAFFILHFECYAFNKAPLSLSTFVISTEPLSTNSFSTFSDKTSVIPFVISNDTGFASFYILVSFLPLLAYIFLLVNLKLLLFLLYLSLFLLLLCLFILHFECYAR